MKEGIFSKEKIWRAVLGISFALLVAGFSVILPAMAPQTPPHLAVAWTIAILAAIAIVGLLIYGFIVERIVVIASEMATLRRIVAKSDEMKSFVGKVDAAVTAVQDTHSTATKDLLIAAQELGLEMVYRTRAKAETEITGLLTDAKREVKCLGICISIPSRIPAFRNLVEAKANEGVSFQFLFLQRKSGKGRFDFYRQRAFDENYSTPPDLIRDLKGQATTNINILQAIRRRLSDEKKERLQMAEFEAFPYLSLIIIDDAMFVGPYLFGETCANQPMFKVKKGDGIYSIYYKHFSDLWRSAAVEDAKADLLG